MAVYAMITQTGLNETNTSMPDVGPLIDVAYWVASYDTKLASDYENELIDLYSNIANYTSANDNYPMGLNIYWNGGGVQTSANPVVNNLQTSAMYTGVTYSAVAESSSKNFIDNWDVDQNAYPVSANEGDWWRIVGSGTIVDDDNIHVGVQFDDGDVLLYTGTAFINATKETNRYRANFRVNVQSDSNRTEPMIINKVGLFAVERSVDGVISGNPFLFAQVIIPNAQTISPKTANGNVDSLVIDFEIDSQAVLKNFDDIIYSSPNDYWMKATDNDGQYGLSYEGQVYITNRLGLEDQHNVFPSDDVGVGKLLVATYKTVNKANIYEEDELPQLVLQYNKTRQHDVNGQAYTQRIRTTFRTNPDGDCELDFYGSCSNEFGYYSLVPKEDRLFGLGHDDRRWKAIKSSELVEVYLGDDPKSNGLIDASDTYGYIRLGRNSLSSNNSLGLGWFGNSSIIVGPYNNTAPNVNTNNYYYMYGNVSNLIPTGNNRGYDLALRSTNDIYLYNMASEYLSSNEVAGGKGNDSQTTLGEIYQLANVFRYSYNFNKDFNNQIKDSYFKKFYTSSVWNSLSHLLTDVDALRNTTYGQTNVGDITDQNGSGINKDILIAAQRYMFVHGDIAPLIDSFTNLGTEDHRFRGLYAATLHGAILPQSNTFASLEGTYPGDLKAENYGLYSILTIDADIVPIDGTKKIRRNFAGERFEYINCKDLGKSNDYIDNGYITNIFSAYANITTIVSQNIDSVYMKCSVLTSPNIFCSYINNIPIAEYLKGVTTYAEYYELKSDSGDNRVSIGVTDHVKSDPMRFNFTVHSVVDQEDVVKSLSIVFAPGDLLVDNKKRWFEKAWKRCFTLNGHTLTNILKGLLGDTAFNNAVAVGAFSKSDNAGTTGVTCNDKQVRDHGAGNIQFHPNNGIDDMEIFYNMEWGNDNHENAWEATTNNVDRSATNNGMFVLKFI